MDLSWESLYAQFPGLSSPISGHDRFNPDDFFEQPKKKKVCVEEVDDSALMYMEESFDLDKLTELSAISEKDIMTETTVKFENAIKQESNSQQIFYPSDSQQFYEEESKQPILVAKPQIDLINIHQLVNALPPESEEFLQDLLSESKANTYDLPVNANVESEVPSTKPRIILPKGTIAYTLDLVPGTSDMYVVSETTNTLNNSDLLSLGLTSTTDGIHLVPSTSSVVPSQSPTPASPLQSHVVPSPSHYASVDSPAPCSSSDSEWTPARSAPYSRRSKISPEERKKRKMEQNKTAAVRYRQKKHREAQEHQEEREALITKRDSLKKEADGLAAELSVLKKLMREFGYG